MTDFYLGIGFIYKKGPYILKGFALNSALNSEKSYYRKRSINVTMVY